MSRRIVLVDIGQGLTLRGALPSVALGADYSARLTASGGSAPYIYSIIAGAAELAAAGLFLDPATGIISGTTLLAGSIGIIVRATDISGAFAQRAFTVTVIAEPAVLTLSGTFADATVGVAYSSDLTISNGSGGYTLTGGTGVASGSLPAGLALSIVGDKLRLSGTPTTAGSPSFTVSVDSGDGQTATSAQSIIVSPAALGFADAVIALGPTAYWRLDDTTTTAADSSGNGRNGTWSAGTGTYTQSQPSLLPHGSGASVAKTGQALVTVPAVGSIPGFNAWTIMALVKPSSFPQAANVIFRMSNGPQLAFNAAGKLLAGIADSVNYAASTGAIATGATALVGISVNGTTATYYINGAASGTVTVANRVNSLLTFYLCNTGPAGIYPYLGSMQEVAIFYGTALSATNWADLWDAA